MNPKRRDRKKMKILKSKKALSPVVASIILIAVTVAVSIAVAAWMGALTFSFMGSSSLSITNMAFEAGNTTVLSVKNTGTSSITVGTVKVNNAVKTFTGDTILASGANGTITVNAVNWVAGNPYKVDLYDTSGTGIGSYQANAPS